MKHLKKFNESFESKDSIINKIKNLSKIIWRSDNEEAKAELEKSNAAYLDNKNLLYWSQVDIIEDLEKALASVEGIAKKYRIEQFNEKNIFQKIGRGFSKFLKPGEIGDIVEGIFADVKEDFDVNNLRRTGSSAQGEKECYVYTIPTTSVDEESVVIRVETSDLGHESKVVKSDLYLNNEKVTDLVNKHTINDIFDFFREKFENPEGKKRSRYISQEDDKNKRVKSLKDRYKKYSTAPGGGRYFADDGCDFA